MATYRVRLKITEPSFGNADWYCEAINRDGNTMTYAYAPSREAVIRKVVDRVREMYYNDVDIEY